MVAIIILWYIVPILRKRRLERLSDVEHLMLPDKAFNALLTTKTISRVLSEKGIDVRDANSVIEEAENAMRQGHYGGVILLTDRAKNMMNEAKQKKEAIKEEPNQKNIESKSVEDRTRSQPFYFAGSVHSNEALSPEFRLRKKYPGNYLQSKFEISCAESAISEAEKKGRDTSKAVDYLKTAKVAFERKEYTEALKYALKSKKSAEGLSIKEVESAPVSQSKAEEEKIEELLCVSCHTPIKETDNFCAKCGTKIEIQLCCPDCGAVVEKTDVFCRKCGMSLSVK